MVRLRDRGAGDAGPDSRRGRRFSDAASQVGLFNNVKTHNVY